MSYEQLRDALADAPMTWVPGLLRVLVRRALHLHVFTGEDGMVEFLRLSIRRER